MAYKAQLKALQFKPSRIKHKILSSQNVYSQPRKVSVNTMTLKLVIKISNDSAPFTFAESLFHRVGATMEMEWALKGPLKLENSL